MTTPLDRYRTFLETLGPETLPGLAEHVTAEVRFADPFNDVRGVEAMTRVFGHMFAAVSPVSFRVEQAAAQGDVSFMQWRFSARLRRAPWSFDGVSVLRFTADGRVGEHVDYWDAARHFHERLPILGRLSAAIRRRVSTG